MRVLFARRLVVGCMCAALVLSILAFQVQAGSKPGGGGGEKWTKVNVDCGGDTYGFPTVYNVDENGDGKTDYAAFLFESPVIVGAWESGGEFTYYDKYWISSPARNIWQFGMLWKGYKALGTCLSPGIVWQVQVVPQSKYQNYPFTPSVFFFAQLTIPPGQMISAYCWQPGFGRDTCLGGDTISGTVYLWEALSGAWTSITVNGMDYTLTHSAYYLSNWFYARQDFATSIKNTGSAEMTAAYTLGSILLGYNYVSPAGQALCSGVGMLNPGGFLHFQNGGQTYNMKLLPDMFQDTCWFAQAA